MEVYGADTFPGFNGECLRLRAERHAGTRMIFFLPILMSAASVTAVTVMERRRVRLAAKTLPVSQPAPVGMQAPAPPASPALDVADDKGIRLRAGFVGSTLPHSEDEKRELAALRRGSVGLGLSTVGVFFPPLQLAGIALTMPEIKDEFADAWHALVHERRIRSSMVSSAFVVGSVAGGYFFTLTAGGWLIGLNRWLAAKAERESRQGLVENFSRLLDDVRVVYDGSETDIPAEQVRPGDVVVIRAGATTVLDGVVLEGFASVDQHLLTGELQPAELGPGDRVTASTPVLAGRALVRVELPRAGITAPRLGHAVADIDGYKKDLAERLETASDKAALPSLFLGLVAAPFVGLGGAMSMLMVSAAYRMKLYSPLSMLRQMDLAAGRGILVKDGRALERARTVDTVVFDKFAVRSMEKAQVVNIHSCAGFLDPEVLRLAAAAETNQTHPLARAILAAAEARSIAPPVVDHSEYVPGFGIEVRLGGRTVRAGSRRFMAAANLTVPPAIDRVEADARRNGHSVVYVAADGSLAGVIVLERVLREDCQTMIVRLRSRGLKIWLLSGEPEEATKQMASRIGADRHFSDRSTQEKAALIKQLQQEGSKICLVGDGVRDAAAHKSALVSVSLRGPATIAEDGAQMVILRGEITQLRQVFGLATEFAISSQALSFASSLPSFVIVGGTIFFGWGLLTNMLLYQVSIPFTLHRMAKTARSRQTR